MWCQTWTSGSRPDCHWWRRCVAVARRDRRPASWQPGRQPDKDIGSVRPMGRLRTKYAEVCAQCGVCGAVELPHRRRRGRHIRPREHGMGRAVAGIAGEGSQHGKRGRFLAPAQPGIDRRRGVERPQRAGGGVEDVDAVPGAPVHRDGEGQACALVLPGDSETEPNVVSRPVASSRTTRGAPLGWGIRGRTERRPMPARGRSAAWRGGCRSG